MKIGNFEIFYNLVQRLKEDNIPFVIFGNYDDAYVGLDFANDQKINNKFSVRLILQSSIGSFDFYKFYDLESDKALIDDMKEKLDTFPVIRTKFTMKGLM